MNDDFVQENYSKSIKKLAEKNGIEYEVMLDNWIKKYEEFDNITNSYGIDQDTDLFDKNENKPFIALTINGSIVISSAINNNQKRNIRYQSIKIRTDESKNVPEYFEDNLARAVEINKKILFEKTIETSVIIRIKTADNIILDDFEEKAEQLTAEFTKVFELIDEKTITKRLEE